MTAPTLRERAREASLVFQHEHPEHGSPVSFSSGYISGSLDTMRECAKLVCGYCPDPHMHRAAMDVYTHLDMVDGETVCLASAIHFALAAEADKGEERT